MATKDHWKQFKDKHDSTSNDSSDVYRNFTLNKNHKCTTAFDQKRSKSVENGHPRNSNYERTAALIKGMLDDDIEKTAAQKDGILLKKFHKNLSKNYFNTNFYDAKEERKAKNNSSSSSSTLSLHIAAYENFIESQVSDSFAVKELKKKGTAISTLENPQQHISGSSCSDHLEFPRQQESSKESKKPEVQQFAASQKLFTPFQGSFSHPVFPKSSVAQIAGAFLTSWEKMTALRSTLHKLLFQPSEERLIDVVQILPQGGKKTKKECYMCLAMTAEQPYAVRLYVVKADRNDIWRKKEKFTLRDIRTVDGINPRKTIPEFNMIIMDQNFALATSTYEEKEKFIRQLYKFANQYLPVHKPEFVNIQLPVEVAPVNLVPEQSEAVLAENLPLSAKEEADFYNLLSKSNLTIGEAKKFAGTLTQKLLELDGANIESIMGNEQAVTDLINLMDGAIEEVTCLEKQLDEMDTILLYVRDSVELIEEKDSLGQVERQNNEKLRKELEEFLYHLDTISDNHIRVLRNAQLSDPTSINQCCLAARAMNQFLNKKSELCTMAAFQSRVDELNLVRDEFVDKFFSHITALFERMGTMVEDQEWDSMILQIQTQRYRFLLPFCELISWLKLSRSKAYHETLRRYIKEAEALFRKEFDRFFGAINQRAKTLSGRRDSSVGTVSKTDQAYVSLLETIMGETRNAVEAEQKFCIRFFHISGDLLNNIDTKSSESGDSSGAFSGGKTIERQFNDQVKTIVQPIFSSFLPNLSQFIEICGSQNNLCLILLYVNLSKKMQTHQDTTSFFTGLYGSSMILFKQRVDQLMQSYAYSFESFRPPKKMRVGILPIISQYENLARHAELLFENSERRTDLEKWHEKLIDAVFKGINSVAESPNSKSPPAVVRLENFHQLYLSLSALKIECLDTRRKEARKIYQSSIDNYVREYMGRPLEKIHVFFEQIEKALENGIRPEEIGYQQQFSRLELKKVVQAYPGKEVKKGLENLYKKVEKHLIDGSSLIEVVWRQMQDDFLKQLKHYQQLIGKCYPNSRADLEVSIQDVLQYFSEIAQQH